MSEFNETLELEHETLIAEEIEAGTIKSNKDLPKEIRSQITAIAMMIGKYKKNPTEKTKDIIEKKSVEIADEIQNWIDKDKDEETPEKTVEPEKIEEPIKTDEPENVVKTTPEQAEKKILVILEKEKRIYSEDLRDILGEESVDDVPDKIKIGNTILEKSLAYYYKV